MKLMILKALWRQFKKQYLLQWIQRCQWIVCWVLDHQWENDGSWAAKARKCSRCDQREKGKEA